MPQEIRVLQCFTCHVYQVDIVKKSAKWQCKLCGAKQSIFKEHFRGSGRDCRLHVQQLNRERAQNAQRESDISPAADKAPEFLFSMPQEIRVLQCFSCHVYQVDIVKKSAKWQCKLCGAKQSIFKEHFRGSGRDCRLHVQQLNRERAQNAQRESDIITKMNDEEGNKENSFSGTT